MALTRLLASLTALVAAASLAACGAGSSNPAASSPEAGGARASTVSGEVTVLAAASLRDAFEDLAGQFEAVHPGTRVTFDFQGSQDLVAALAEGASADVLATADERTMDEAVSEQLVAAPVQFATNTLTLIVPAGNPAGVSGLNSSLEGADLVICAPEVPCGAATARLASELGIRLQPVSLEQKVTDVRGKVASGEADAGIVYTTDAAAAGQAVESITLPVTDVRNHYPIALVSTASNAAAGQALIDLVLSDAGQQVLQGTYGFGAPEPADAAQ